MKQHYCVLLAAGMVSLSLSGCSSFFGQDGFFRDRQDDYLKARVVDPIAVPESLDSSTITELYVIPPTAVSGKAAESFEVPQPAVLSAADLEETVRIQKLGNRQWVLVNVPPAQLWPQLRHFLFAQRMQLGRDNGMQGMMDTAWMTPFNQTGAERERYRFRVEQGVQRNTAEIHVVQIESPPMAASEAITWPAQSLNADQESWMITQLANYLATSVGVSSVSLLAQGINTTSKMVLEKDADGYPVILVRLDYDRAWASLSRSLEKAEFRIDERLKDNHRYEVTYWPRPREEDIPGFWGRLLGKKTPDYADAPYAGERYSVQVEQKGDQVEIAFKQLDLQDFSREEAEHLVNLIKGYLS